MNDNSENALTLTLSQAIRRSAIGLAIFAFFTAGIIAITQVLTAEKIGQNEREFEARLLLSLLPDEVSATDILASSQALESTLFDQTALLATGDSARFYQQLNQQGLVSAVILPVIAPEGYTEAIRLIVGIDASGQVIGVRVTKHKETPGLGDAVEISKSNWILGFNGKSLSQPTIESWQVEKDGGEFDQLTGATITPRAIVKAVKQSLQFFELNKSLLLTPYFNSEVES